MKMQYKVEDIRNNINTSLFDCQAEVFIYEDSLLDINKQTKKLDIQVNDTLYLVKDLMDTDKFNLSKLNGDILKNRVLLLLLTYNKAFELCDWYQIKGCGDNIIKIQSILHRIEGVLAQHDVDLIMKIKGNK